MKALRFTPRRAPRIATALVFPVLILSVLAIFMGRRVPALRCPWWMETLPGFYSHISNFSISLMLCLGIGYAWLLAGVALRGAVVLCLCVAISNLIYESFIPLLNTRDPVDAVYGVVGTALAMAILLLFDRFGMHDNAAAAPG